MTREELKQKALSLPLSPGVYIMMNEEGEVIYVGKSRALKNRVSQYFVNLASHTSKTRNMVRQIDHFDYILADSEFEALVLECSLIKRHQPRYNILLKDDKGYPYVRLSVQQRYPRFSLVNRVSEDGARYFGPYGSRSSTREIIRTISAALRLPTCRRQFPRDIGKDRPCLNHHLGNCDGWCRPEMTQEAYHARIQQAIRLLDGKFSEVEKELETEMLQASEELRFEQAAELRDWLQAIRLLGVRQKVVAGVQAETDVVGVYQVQQKFSFAVLHYLEGTLAERDMEQITLPVEESEGEVLSALLKQYYGTRGHLPKVVCLPCDFEDWEDLERMLTEQAGRKVELLVPKRGNKVNLVRLANKNAREELERSITKEERKNQLLSLFGSMLGLENPPRRIEAYDISNTGSDDIVGGMTVFVDGKPLKSAYRKFHLKDMQGPDDYASMDSGAHPPVPALFGGQRKVQRPARRHSDGRRTGTGGRGLSGAGASWIGRASVRHGQGRTAPHPCAGGAGRPRNWAASPACHLCPGGTYPRGDPPVRHLLPPHQPQQTHRGLGAGGNS